ncbi:hypothetical protein ESZ50_00620 [Weissella muntiaci]|uniref:Uncharacterized protein n=1 Tax=Weissella muntiaci TaxID=2508881 RepID=A0A6C2CA96_9LACO|nr:hypothetical protein [Weissella muntiaci]TYC51070.1 hypothetical protein ESZ50_00620 [Weissella muntiaci]
MARYQAFVSQTVVAVVDLKAGSLEEAKKEIQNLVDSDAVYSLDFDSTNSDFEIDSIEEH